MSKDDDRFYAYLTDLLKVDLVPISKFDRAMRRDNKRDKCFYTRAMKVLTPHVAPQESFETYMEALDVKAADVTAASNIRQLAHFLSRLVGVNAAPPAANGQMPNVPESVAVPSALPQGEVVAPQAKAEPLAQQWDDLVSAAAAVLALAKAPNAEVAQALLEKAQALLSCAQAHAEQASARNQLVERLADLRAQFDGCLSLQEQAEVGLPDVLWTGMDPDELDLLLEACEGSTRSLAEIERQQAELKAASALAETAEDFAELAILSQKRAETKQQRQAVQAERAAVLVNLAAELAKGSDKEEGAEAPVPLGEVAPPPDVVGAQDGEVEAAVTPEAEAEAEPETAVDADMSESEPDEPDIGLTVARLTEAEVDPSPESAVAEVVDDSAAAWPEPTPEADAEDLPSPTLEPVATSAIDAAATPLAKPESDADQWRGDQGIEKILSGYLHRGETLFAARLLELAEERGIEVPLPAAMLLAVHESRMALKPLENINVRLTGALDLAVAAVAELEANGKETLATSARHLVLAALLRPALFGAYDTARDWLRQMRLTGPERQLAQTLAGLGYAVHPTFDDLRAMAGNTATQRLAELTDRLVEVMEANRQKKLTYQPASELLHRLFEPNGMIGCAFEAAILNGAGAVPVVEAALEAIPSEAAGLPGFVEVQAQQQLGQLRRIEGAALRGLCKLIETAGDLLRDWLGAARAGQGQADSRRRGTLGAHVKQVRKDAGAVLASLAAGGGEGLSDAVAATLRAAVEDLMRLCDGEEPSRPAPRLDKADGRGWGADLLRLTGGAQPRYETGADYLQEMRDQRDTLYAGLLRPESHAPSFAAAFEAHLRDGAMLAAHDVLSLAARAPHLVPGLDPEEAEKRLVEEIGALRGRHRAEIEMLSSHLAMLWYLAVDHRAELADAMQRLTVIEAALTVDPAVDSDAAMIPALNGLRTAVVPPDFPELERVLARVRAFLAQLSAQIAEDQRQRLLDLARQDQFRDHANGLLARMGSFDPVTIDSMIGQIQSGLPFVGIENKAPDTLARFYPAFVEAVRQRVETPVKLVEAGLRGEDRLNLPPLQRGQDQEKRALDLMRYWSSFTAAMKSGNADQMRQHLVNVLGELGFARSRLADGTPLIRNRLHSFTLNASLQLGRDQFLPPIYGSEANGKYNVLIADESVRDRELSTHLGNMGRDRPSFLIVLGRLDRRRRETLAGELRLERQTTVLLDESLIVFIALGQDAPLETLFACGLPFGYLQPYTTKPRTIPPEMFFGRKEEIQRIIARESGGCLVYGGRQLGKSALLNHVRQLYDTRGGDQRVINIDIKPVGGRGVPADRLWRDLADELSEQEIFDLKDYTAKSFRTEVTNWLKARPRRQLLVMLDEADNFLAAEARHGTYANLHVLKDLMERTNWAFKVVFAGLHNVRRMSRAANSPLPHLGKPICIGPLDSNPENLTEARRLVTAPMRAAGYDYDDPALAYSILARVNYYPSLVQVFCQTVIENAGNARRVSGSGPYWKLGNAELFEGAIWRSISEDIRTRFRWTLELDWRYEAIAKVIAYLGSDGPEGNTQILRTGLSSEDIRRRVNEFWPQGIAPLAPIDFQALLHEMTDLGVLSQPVEGRFVLRNTQVAQLLGSREELEQALMNAMEREEQVDYDPASFHSPYGGAASEESAPVTDAQLDLLLADQGNRGKVGVLVGQHDLWSGPDAKGLKDLIEQRSHEGMPLTVAMLKADRAVVRSQVDAKLDHPKERRVLLICGEWDAGIGEYLASHSRVKDGILRPIWLLPARWLVQANRLREVPSYVAMVCAQPWTTAMLRHWMESHGLTKLDQPALRDAILAATGGLPGLLRVMLPWLQQQTATASTDVEDAIRQWDPPTGRNAPRPDLAALGFLPAEAAQLKEVAMELLTSDEASVHSPAMRQEGQEALLHSAEALGLLHRRDDRIVLSPLGRLLTK